LHAGGQRFDPARLHFIGGLVERLNTPVLKTGDGNTSVGSNPTPSSISSIMNDIVAGWSSLVARRAHNPKVAGSNPVPATNGPVV
jgi:hypothetical protein